MIDSATYLRVLTPGSAPDQVGIALIESVRFENPEQAWKRLQNLAESPAQRESLSRSMPALLAVLEEAATPDSSLVNLDRFLRSVPDRDRTLEYLAENPRGIL